MATVMVQNIHQYMIYFFFSIDMCMCDMYLYIDICTYVPTFMVRANHLRGRRRCYCHRRDNHRHGQSCHHQIKSIISSLVAVLPFYHPERSQDSIHTPFPPNGCISPPHHR